jgi:hypothetical protein
MPEKRLLPDVFASDDGVCALGALGQQRGVVLADLDPEDYEQTAHVFGVAPALVREIMFINDEVWGAATPESRYRKVRAWVVDHLEETSGTHRHRKESA